MIEMKHVFVNWIKILIFLVLRYFQCILLLHTSLDVGIYFNFSFDTIMSYFLNPRANVVYVKNTVSSFQKPIINPFFF